MADEGQVAPEATPPAAEQTPAVFQVEVDGQMSNYNAADPRHVEAAIKGSLRQQDYTRKAQDVARQRNALLDRELSAPAARPQSGLDTGYGGFDGVLPSMPVGEEPERVPAYPPIEYPNAGTPTGRGRSLAPYDVPQPDPDEPMTRGEFQRALQVQAHELTQQQEQMMAGVRAQQAAAIAQQHITEMANDPGMTGFSEQAVQEAFHLAAPTDQQRYQRARQNLGWDEACRMVYNERIRPQTTPAQQPAPGGPTLEGQPQQAPVAPPYADGSRAPGFNPNATPTPGEGPADTQAILTLGEMVSNLPTTEEVKTQL